MNIKLFAVIMIMAFVAVPVFAQNQDGTKIEANQKEAVSEAVSKTETTESKQIMTEARKTERMMVEDDDETTTQTNRNNIIIDRENKNRIEGNQPVSENGAAINEKRTMDSKKLGNQEGSPLNIGANKKGEVKQIKSKIANEHRNVVANFVHSLLDVADRQGLGGIGEKVREMAMQQNKSEEKTTPLMDKIKNKSRIRQFFFGTDFAKTKEIKMEMLETKKRLNKLEEVKDEIVGSEDKIKIGEEIENLRSNMKNVLAEVKAEESKFSLFGWAKRLFIK